MSVQTKHPEYSKLIAKWKRCRDVAKGQDAVHAAGVEYLPALKNQEDEEYQSYKRRATFFNATWRTISGLSGMLFRKSPKLAIADSVLPLLDTVTQDGQSLTVFAMEVVEECLKVGRVGILVDYPVVNAAGMTMADAQLLNLRPTLAEYEAESIINWRTEVRNNRRVLTMVVLCEEREEKVDEFETKEEERYRVLDLIEGKYRVRLFKVDKTTQQDIQIGDDMFPLMNNAPLSYIPFYFLSSDDTEVCPDDPPLIDLVDLNLAHYRVTADYEHGCHFTALPTGWIAGHTMEEGQQLYVGSQTFLILPSADAKVGFLEFSGAGLSALKTNLDHKEAQMAVLGARMLEPQKKAVETAEVAAVHRSGDYSVLAAMAQSISIGMTQALKTFSMWAGGGEDVTFELNRDFLPMQMTSQQLSALVLAWQQGGISKQTLFDNLKAGEIIAADKDFETEETQITNQLR